MKGWGRCLLLAAALSAGAPSAWAGDAQSPEKAQRAGAQKTFEAGSKLFDSRHFEEALAAFKASYQIVNSPNSRLMIARCLRELGRDAEAYREYDAVTAEAARGGDRYRSSGEAAAEERDEIKSKLAFLTVRVEGGPPGVRVKVGDVTLSDADVGVAVPFEPGDVVVTAETPDGASARSKVTLAAGALSDVALRLTRPVQAPAAPAPVAPAPAPAAPAQPPSTSSLRTWSYVAGGVGVAGLVTFAVFGAMTASKYSSLESSCPDKRCPVSKQGDIDAGKTDQVVANVGLGVGIAGIAAGVTLFFLGDGHDDDHVKVGLGLGGARVNGRF